MLEFKMLKDPEYTGKLLERIDNLIAGKTTTDTTKKDSASAKKDSLLAKKDSSKIKDTGSAKNDQKKLTEEEFKKQHPFIGLFAPGPGGEILISEDQKDAFNKIMNREDVQQILGDDAELLFSAKPIFGDKGKKFLYVYCVKKNAELKGNVVTEARATPSQTGVGNVVNMSMNDEGAIQWARITGANIGKRCAIVLDNMVYSAPVIKNQISGGGSEISGMGDMQEAKLLEIVLKAGALPAPVEIIEERVVGPSLGQDSISKGTNSMISGYLIIGIFMIFYYQRSGSIAALCLFLTIYFILGILAGFKATLTLPGIAGVVLTMATAVDANVLVFERIREELAVGKTLRAAVDSGYTRAYTAILDSNVTTFITGVVMYQFGTGPIQGFALTLMIGIITSLFSALMIARVIMDYMLNKNYKLTIG
jgi:preprotein translocase subunit SecD